MNLHIGVTDLPELSGAWTKQDVRRLRQERPQWLTDARRLHAATREAHAAEIAARLDAAPVRLGYTAEDAGTVEQAALYVDFACTHLMIDTGCTEEEADRAVWRRWPRSLAAEDDDDPDMGFEEWMLSP